MPCRQGVFFFEMLVHTLISKQCISANTGHLLFEDKLQTLSFLTGRNYVWLSCFLFGAIATRTNKNRNNDSFRFFNFHPILPQPAALKASIVSSLHFNRCNPLSTVLKHTKMK